MDADLSVPAFTVFAFHYSIEHKVKEGQNGSSLL